MSAEKKTDFQVVNHSIPRRDGRVKVTGKAAYVSDLKLIGMAYAKVLRSPYAHAKIIAIDKSKAESHPGVYCVVTGYDLDGLNPYYGHAVKDHPLLAIDKVRYAGEPVAAVVAVDERTAFEALEFIEVQYEELKAIFTPQEALAPDAPLLHQRQFEAGALRGFEGEVTAGKGTNICQKHQIKWGNVEEAFKNAAAVIEGDYYFPMTYAYAMEAYVAIAEVNAQDVTIYSSAQHPFMVRHDLKSIFNLPVSSVRLIVPFVGGGYGSKSYTKIEPLVAACAWKAKRPVKLQLTIEEAMLTTRSDDAYTWMRTAVDANGKIIARQAKIMMNTGAYAENSPLVVEKSTNRCVGPYAIPNVLIENMSLYTNTVPASSYRGFGCAQVTLPGESQIDELAAKIGKDPYEFRLANVAKPGEEFFPGMRPFDGTLKQDLDTAAKAIGWGKPVAERSWPDRCSVRQRRRRLSADLHRDSGARRRFGNDHDGQHGVRTGQPHDFTANRRRRARHPSRQGPRRLLRYRDHSLRPFHRREPNYHLDGERDHRRQPGCHPADGGDGSRCSESEG